MIHTWSTGVADENMDEAILVELDRVVARHPWWHARARLTLSLLEQCGVHPPARVLDAGCGWGVTLRMLEGKGYAVTGADISRRCLRQLDGPGRDLAEADLTQPIPTGVEPYDAVLSLDVIEHLDDDHAAVVRLAELTKPGGVVIVSVPALPELFGEFDRIQGHRRRYLPDSLRTTFDGAGLTVERIFWWGAWMVPLMRRRGARVLARPGDTPSQVYRKHLALPPWPATWLLAGRFALEQARALRGDLRTGTSLFCVARRS